MDDAKLKLTLTRPVQGDWQPNDKIVVTSTDYLPEHSELAEILSVEGATVTLKEPLKFTHNTTQYDVGARIGPSNFRTRSRRRMAASPRCWTRPRPAPPSPC